MVFIGIDPGKKGGVAILRDDKVVLSLNRMPSTDLETSRIFSECVSGTSNVHAMLERVHSRPGQSSVATFTFGTGYGFLKGCLSSFKISYDEVLPKKWQKCFNVSPRKKGESRTQFKDRLRGIASSLFPQETVWEKTLDEQRSVCDALLIAEYCRRLYLTGPSEIED